MIGWEFHIQVKNLSSSEVDKVENDNNDVVALEDTCFLVGSDFEICALDNSGNGPLSINVYDAENNLILEMQGFEASHYSEKDELASKEWDVDMDINLSTPSITKTRYVLRSITRDLFSTMTSKAWSFLRKKISVLRITA